MKAPTVEKNPASKKKKTATKKAADTSSAALSICPTNGAGWCPYPFSVEQLERRLKEKAAKAADKKVAAKSAK